MYYSGSDTNVNILNLALGVVTVTTDYTKFSTEHIKHANADYTSTIFIEIYKDSESAGFLLFKFYQIIVS